MSNKVITFHYVLKDKEGNVLDQSEKDTPMSFLSGHNQIIPGLEEALAAMTAGDKQDVTVDAANAYGDHRPELIGQVQRDQLPTQEIEKGMQFQVEQGGQLGIVTVTDFDDQTVTLDANHPLAGQDLHFQVEVTDIRDATEDEIAHGHAHGEGGVQH